MSFNHTLRYRTFDQLIDDVSVDFRNYSLQNMIEPQQLIKVVMRVNYELGLRIMQQKDAVVEVCHGHGKLPDDFFALNYGMLCGSHTVEQIIPSGTHVQDIPCSNEITPYYVAPAETPNLCGPDADQCTPRIICNPCAERPTCCLNECGGTYELVQIVKTQKFTYKYMYPLKIRSSKFVDCDCPNIGWQCPDEASIKDGFIYTNFSDGKVYINYQGLMEDDKGNLLLPDHPLLNEFYEYAVKHRILENLYIAGEDVAQKLQYIASMLRPARNNATSLVNTPNFEEMRRVFEVNRRAQYSKYYSMFATNDGRRNAKYF